MMTPDHMEVLARHASRAAHILASLTEWAPAGYMLRVAHVAAESEPPRVALTFALNARAECLNDEGRRVCSRVIEDIERAIFAFDMTP